MQLSIVKSDWVTLEKFCEKTGNKADTIRKNIRAGGEMFKISAKFMNRIHVDHFAYLSMVSNQNKMAA